jgi:hypothetical protein
MLAIRFTTLALAASLAAGPALAQTVAPDGHAGMTLAPDSGLKPGAAAAASMPTAFAPGVGVPKSGSLSAPNAKLAIGHFSGQAPDLGGGAAGPVPGTGQ